MELLFVNRYTPNPKMFEHFYYHTSQKASHIIGLVGLGVLFFGFLVLMAAEALSFWSIFALILGALLSLLLTFFYKFSAVGAMKRTMDMHGGKTCETVIRFFSDGLVAKEGNETVKLSYSELSKVVDCGKHYVALMADKTNGIIVRKGGFSGGDYKDFMTFIKRKVEQ